MAKTDNVLIAQIAATLLSGQEIPTNDTSKVRIAQEAVYMAHEILDAAKVIGNQFDEIEESYEADI